MFEELGTTPDEVANALRARGIQGVRNTVRFLNPLVRYATTLFPDAKAIDIILGDRLRIEFANHSSKLVVVPPPVLEFLEEFHRGGYPDLEMPTESG
jgi:hypothetical protein